MTTEIIYVWLRNPDQKEAFLKTLSSGKINYISYPKRIYALSHENRLRLADLGFVLEDTEVVDLSKLPQADRNAIKQRCRENALARTPEGIQKLRERYGG